MFCRRTPGCRPERPKDNNVVITALPLYHIFSLTANCLVFTQTGAGISLITNPRDFPAFVAVELKTPVHLYQRREHTIQRIAEHVGF